MPSFHVSGILFIWHKVYTKLSELYTNLLTLLELLFFQPRWKVPCVFICKKFCGLWSTFCNRFTSQNWLANQWKSFLIGKNCWCGESLICFYCFCLLNVYWFKPVHLLSILVFCWNGVALPLFLKFTTSSACLCKL